MMQLKCTAAAEAACSFLSLNPHIGVAAVLLMLQMLPLMPL